MSEFEELLGEILAADASPVLPAGMQKRIVSAVFAPGNRRFARRRFELEAVAAAIVIGLAGLLLVRHGHPAASVGLPGEGAGAAQVAMARGGFEMPPVVETSQRRSVGGVPVREVRSKPAVQGVAPLAVVSLVVEPMRIEPLGAGKPIEEGEVR